MPVSRKRRGGMLFGNPKKKMLWHNELCRRGVRGKPCKDHQKAAGAFRP
jgi:hypothetical protein